MKNVKQVYFYNLKSICQIAKILNACGKDMAKKYDLHHWDNPMIKSFVIVCLCLLKNRVFLVMDGNNSVATFQYKEQDDALFFEKLAVLPSTSGSGVGSFCIECFEKFTQNNNKKKVRFEVYEKSQHAIDFYLHRNYKTVGRTGTLKYTNLIMEKNLQ